MSTLLKQRARLWLLSAVLLIIFSVCIAIAPQARASVVLGHASTAVVPNGLVDYWTLDGNATNWRTNTTIDSSGQGNTGTLISMSTSTSPTPGKIGGALSFNGANSYVKVTTDNGFSSKTQGSISLWFYIKAATTGTTLIRSGTVSADTPSLALFSSTILTFHTSGSEMTIGNPTTLLNGWHHIVATWTASGRIAYIDGVKVASGTAPGSWGTGWSIGSDNSGTGVFNGTLDDVRIYNRALSFQEVQQLYKAGGGHLNEPNPIVIPSSNFESGLVGYWPMEEGSGNITRDLSPFGNTGTLLNSPTWTIGRYGKALNFVGASSQDVSMSNTASLSISTGTVSAWVNGTNCTGNAGFCGVVIKQLAYSLYTLNNVFGLYDWSAATFRSSGVNVADGKWHMITASFQSGVAGGTNLYVDGVLKLNTNMTVTSQSFGLAIGYSNSTTQYYNGKIDDVRVYNRVLSAAEIKQLYLNESANIAHSNTVALSNGLMGYWPLDGSTSNWTTGKTNDLSGQSHTGQFVAMSTSSSPTAGKVGGALNFNGSTQYITVAGTPVSFPLTMSAWIKSTSSTGSQVIISSHDTSNGGYRIADLNGQLDFTLGAVSDYSCALSIPVNTWTYVAVTVPGNNSTATCYVNSGSGMRTATVSIGALSGGNTTYVIGEGFSNAYFSGAIDELRVYNRLLSSQEIQNLYLLGK